MDDPILEKTQWTTYVKQPAITQHQGTFTVTFADSWMVFIYTSGGCTVEVTYDISVGEGIPGFTWLPTLLGLGILGTVEIIRKYHQTKINHYPEKFSTIIEQRF